MVYNFKRFRSLRTNILIFLFFASLFINGCFPVVPIGPKPDGQPFISSADIERFKSEKATREQVLEHFGEPHNGNESYFLYLQAQERLRTCLFRFFLFPTVLPADVLYSQRVRFQFDSEGHVFDAEEEWGSVILEP